MTLRTSLGGFRLGARAAAALRWVRDPLPRGGPLPESSWNRRHWALLAVLWAHVPGLVVYGTLRGKGLVHSGLEALIVAAMPAQAPEAHDFTRQCTCDEDGLAAADQPFTIVGERRDLTLFGFGHRPRSPAHAPWSLPNAAQACRNSTKWGSVPAASSALTRATSSA